MTLQVAQMSACRAPVTAVNLPVVVNVWHGEPMFADKWFHVHSSGGTLALRMDPMDEVREDCLDLN